MNRAASQPADGPGIPESISITTFKNVKDNVPVHRPLTWPALVKALTTHQERATKDGRLWSPATYPPCAKRGLFDPKRPDEYPGPLAVSLFVLDLDDGTPWEAIKTTLNRLGLAYIAYSTFNHMREKEKGKTTEPACARYRVVIPFAAPVPAGEWPDVWERANRFLADGHSDIAAKDASRIYYTPANIPGSERFAEHGEGFALDASILPHIERPQETGARPLSMADATDATDAELIDLAMNAKNGDRFRALWNGDTTGHENDASKADAALCSDLAWWTNGDAGRMDRLFRQSGLMRPKWDERRGSTTYGARTICFAVKNTPEGYAVRTTPFSEPRSNGEAATPTREPAASPGRPRVYTAADLQAMELAEPEWIIPGLLPQVGATLLASRPKLGKSWLGLGLSVAVATGGRAFGRYLIPQGAVLYLALEDTERRLKSRVEILLGPTRWPTDLSFATEWPRFGEGGESDLDEWLTTHSNARLVIVDTLAKARCRRQRNADPYQAEYEALSIMKAAADRHGVAMLIIHHVRKMDSDDPLDGILGSTAIAGCVDTVWVLKRQRGQADAFLYVDGRDVDQIELALNFDKERCFWSVLGDAEEYRGSKERNDVHRALQGEEAGLSPKELAERLDKNPGAIKKLAWTMSNDGELLNINGRYKNMGNSGNPVTEDPPKDPKSAAFTPETASNEPEKTVTDTVTVDDGIGNPVTHTVTGPHTGNRFGNPKSEGIPHVLGVKSPSEEGDGYRVTGVTHILLEADEDDEGTYE